MKTILTYLLCTLPIFALARSHAAIAEFQEISIDVPFTGELSQAEGIIFGAQGLQTITKTETEAADKAAVVTFSYDDEQVPENAYVSAVVQSTDGKYSFGVVKAISGDGYADSSLLLPTCELDTPSIGLLRSQLSTLKQLVKVRTELRNKKRSKLAGLLTEQRIALIASAEKAFHTVPTEFEQELSADLPPTELSDRLGRLLAAVKHYKVEKQREAARSIPSDNTETSS
jgi:hypothetical protein